MIKNKKKQVLYEQQIQSLQAEAELKEQENKKKNKMISALQMELENLKVDYKKLQEEAKKILLLYKKEAAAKENWAVISKDHISKEKNEEKMLGVYHFTRIFCKSISEKNCIIPYRNETKNSKEYHRILKKDFEKAIEEVLNNQEDCEGLVLFLYAAGAVKNLDSKTVLFRKELFDWMMSEEVHGCD